MELTVYSRSNNHELWLKMREFIPAHIECVEVTGFDHWRDASRYLYHIIENAKTRWIVNIDIDAFVLDWDIVDFLIKKMAHQGHSHLGVSDSKDVIPHRNGPENSMNPYFNIFNTYKCRQLLHGQDKDLIDYFVGKGPNNEPFHGLFNFLHTSGNSSFVIPLTHYDGIANLLIGNKIVSDENMKPKIISNIPFLLHTWYSREYGTNPEQTERIDYFYKQAKRMSKSYEKN